MSIFDGSAFAKKTEAELTTQVAALRARGKFPKIVAILFEEDSGSRLYTRLKKEAAERVGIGYDIERFSMLAPLPEILAKIRELNADPTVTGIIIQKPWRQRWEEVVGPAGATLGGSAAAGSDQPAANPPDFLSWWHELVITIDERKDVDGLHPNTLEAIKQGNWKEQGKVLPATCAAVLKILEEVGVIGKEGDNAKEKSSENEGPASTKCIILGKSDILGQPLYYELKNLGFNVEMIGSKELQERVQTGQKLLDADVIISATGRQNLVTREMVKDGVVVVDVGEPKPDVEIASVAPKARFITPVPGGVGPVTIVSLLGNAIQQSL